MFPDDGIVAWCIEHITHEIYVFKSKLLDYHFAMHGHALLQLGWFALFCLALVLIGSSLVIFWAPAAVGGGVTHLMAYLNGTHVPDLFAVRTLVAKVVGLLCAIGSSLAVGPEGPMVKAVQA